MIDVLVAGGGPVGLATALYAHRAGLSVAVLEPREAPIDKACGEGLMPAAVQALAELGLDPPGRPFRGIRYLDGDRSAQALFPGAAGRGVRRTVLQSCLREAVAERGIAVHRAAVTEIDQDAGSVRAGGLAARYLVGADGLHSTVRRLAGLNLPARPPARWGLRRHYRTAPWSDLVEVHWCPSSEAYLTPVARDQIGIAILSSDRASFDEQLARFPVLAQRLSAAPGSKVLGAGPLRQRTRARVAGRVLLVGDAAGYVDALTGEGITVGLTAARSLVRCLAAGRPQDYERLWARDSRRYRTLTSGLLWTAGRPVLRRRIVPAAAAAPRVFELVVGQLAR
ncbi:NAD(P)/FAD-dependent oxidoreductase [Jatrophihabitans sp.]|uniref:NAD(P)/FAD-dependent oxidoreductase n=1 Tax=Jatrophihabitans sp. TaxID=1932789 RepID=UPI002C5489DA|nr:NAD(P)/FAD-dependent oxidoreductase [Jatrophihabitans sp.]